MSQERKLGCEQSKDVPPGVHSTEPAGNIAQPHIPESSSSEVITMTGCHLLPEYANPGSKENGKLTLNFGNEDTKKKNLCIPFLGWVETRISQQTVI